MIATEEVDLLGEKFHVAEKVGLMPAMRFAMVAQSGVDANEIEGLAAMHELLRQCVHPQDWDRFQRHAVTVCADGDELMECVGTVMAVLANRPTGRSADSSDGPRIIEPNSTEGSSSLDTGSEKVIQRLNERGRPDLALIVRERQEWLSA